MIDSDMHCDTLELFFHHSVVLVLFTSVVCVHLCDSDFIFSCAVIEEQNVRLKLNVTDTPGFGDQINNEKW